MSGCIICGAPVSKPTYRFCSEHRSRERVVVVDRLSLPPTPQSTPCRVWRGAVNGDGYGQYKGTGIHRWAWEMAHGPIPEGMVVMHLCDNRPCYRLDHLRIGTAVENTADCVTKGRNAVPDRWLGPHLTGERHSQAKLTVGQVKEIRTRLAAGEMGTVLALQYGVSKATISLIRNRRTWAP